MDDGSSVLLLSPRRRLNTIFVLVLAEAGVTFDFSWTRALFSPAAGCALCSVVGLDLAVAFAGARRELPIDRVACSSFFLGRIPRECASCGRVAAPPSSGFRVQAQNSFPRLLRRDRHAFAVVFARFTTVTAFAWLVHLETRVPSSYSLNLSVLLVLTVLTGGT